MRNTTEKQLALIALDWGTTSLRAYLLDGSGSSLAERNLPLGLMNLSRLPNGERDFLSAFKAACADWLDLRPGLPVIACGMVGSAQGWRQADYVDVPARVADICGRLLRIDTGLGVPLWIVPGLRKIDGLSDVIRGEETQVIGAMQCLAAQGPSLVALPGTHSKWVLVEDGCFRTFDTFMTGEVYSALQAHTILGQLMIAGAEDRLAFDRGLKVAASEEAEKGLLATLFSVRTLGLTGRVPAAGLADYLSGLLIGYEVNAVARLYATRLRRSSRVPVVLCGTPALRRRYQRALDASAWADVTSLDSSSRSGLWKVAQGAGLVALAASRSA
ncbi:MAG TPA: 2-dehydro-3-deoxygalactonokinase [Castellaniella sp.]|uniref:2-dehydro-3-deoxygalactonokinase n=1 Tax=Castellaniella sp. TaxID=1955812 RepID=UPI002EED943E